MIESLTGNVSKTAVFALVVAACIALAGCAGAPAQSSSGASGASGASAQSSSASASAASESSSSSKASEGLTFGEKTATALSFTVKNDTGAALSALSVSSAAGEGASVPIMKEGEALQAGEQATIYFEPVAGGLINAAFLVGADERQLHNVDTMLLGQASIKVEGDVAYLTAQVAGNPVSTLQDEYDLAHPPVVEEQYYEEPVYYSYEGNGGGGAPAQTEDACVSDVVLN